MAYTLSFILYSQPFVAFQMGLSKYICWIITGHGLVKKSGFFSHCHSIWKIFACRLSWYLDILIQAFCVSFFSIPHAVCGNLLETFPLDLPQYSLWAQSNYSARNYSLRVFGFWLYNGAYLKNGSDPTPLWGLHIETSFISLRGDEPVLNPQVKNEKPLKQPVVSSITSFNTCLSCSPKYPHCCSPERGSRLSNEHGDTSTVRCRRLLSSVLFWTENTLSWFWGSFISFHTFASRCDVTNEMVAALPLSTGWHREGMVWASRSCWPIHYLPLMGHILTPVAVTNRHTLKGPFRVLKPGWSMGEPRW